MITTEYDYLLDGAIIIYSKKNKMLETIFDSTGFDQSDDLIFVFFDVSFKRDFGPWKQGYKCKGLNVDLDKGIMEEFDTDGTKIINTCNLKLESR